MNNLTAIDVETAHCDEGGALMPFRDGGWLTLCSFVSATETVLLEFPSTEEVLNQLHAVAARGDDLIAWNAMFDIQWMIAIGIDPLFLMKFRWYDAMELYKRFDKMERVKSKQWGYSLAKAIERYYPGQAGFKSADKFHFEAHERNDPDYIALKTRNVEDSRWAAHLGKWFYDSLDQREQVSSDMEAEIMPIIAQSRMQGLLMGTRQIAIVAQSMREQQDEGIRICGLDRDLLNSPAQLSQLLFWPHSGISTNEKDREVRTLGKHNYYIGDPATHGPVPEGCLGLEPKRVTSTGQASTDSYSIQFYMDASDFLRGIHLYKKATTVLNKYVASPLRTMVYNKSHTAYPQPSYAGAYTGRITYSSKTKFRS